MYNLKISKEVQIHLRIEYNINYYKIILYYFKPLLYICVKNKYMKKINHQFQEFYEKGLNDMEISKILDCSNATVSIWRKQNNLPSKITYRIYKIKDKEFPAYSNVYKSHPYFKELRKIFYPKNKKKFPYEHCLKYLNWKAFAYWFGDDGNKLNSGGLQITTVCMKDDLEMIKKVLYNNLGLSPNIHCGKILYFTKKESVLIRSKIKEYLPECLYYKLSSH